MILEIPGKRPYTDEEDALIRSNYLTMSSKEMADVIHRSEGSVRSRMVTLMLKRPRITKRNKTTK